MALACLKNVTLDLCEVHGKPWVTIDEHEFEGCIVGAAQYIAELELELLCRVPPKHISCDPADPENLDKLDF